MPSKTGVYICSGCSIGDALDVKALTRVAEQEYKVALCRTHSFLCGEDGLALIHQGIEGDAVNPVVIAACSARVKADEFRLDPSLVVERVNLRELVSWTHKPKDEDTQALAEDVLRMGITKASKSEPLVPLSDSIQKAILVVGGGLTGLTAALEAAEAGYEVILVEKDADLGGHLRDVKAAVPSQSPYTKYQPTHLAALVGHLQAHPKVKIFTSTTIDRTEGQPGSFRVTLRDAGQTTTHQVGSIIMATGWRPYDAHKLSHLGYGLTPDVVTNVEFEKMAAAGRFVRPSNGKPLKRVLFIQCAGSRDPAHLPYCSSVCCTETLKHAQYLQDSSPLSEIYVVYQDIVAPGRQEAYFQTVQDHPSTFFLRGQVSAVALDEDGRIRIEVGQTLLGKPVGVSVDLVVLATGMVPNAADGDALRALRDAKLKLLSDAVNGGRAEAEKTFAQLQCYAGTEILNLAYRRGPDLPLLANGFADSNFICFPYETMRTGIYAAGAVHSAMDAVAAQEDAMGAALKAIQCVEMATRGEAVHPRAGDLSYPSFLLQRCTQCKRCTEECPFGALDEDEKGTPKLNPYRCRRCGVCMGACPERIVSFKNYSVDIVASMIKAIDVPEDEDKLRILLFTCENDAYPALDAAGINRVQYEASVRVIPVRCLGSLNLVWIADALSRGIDGVMLMGCKSGDDYQCHFAKGSELAGRRLDNIKETLTRLQLEPERIQVDQIAIDEYAKLPAMIDTFVSRVREIGPNPFKGF